MKHENIKRRAPKKGYDNEPKDRYRHKVWSTMAPKVIPLLESDSNARVLLLPSKEGLEIDVAISYGINPNQIIAIDENPALLAHAKWKDKISKENRFGCKVSRVGDKIKSKGWYLVGANLDFCNNLSDEIINETKAFFKNTPLNELFYCAFTIMKGRESKGITHFMRAYDVNYDIDSRRLASFMSVCQFKQNCQKDIKTTLFESQYFDTSPMSYAVFEFEPRTDKIYVDDFNELIDSFAKMTKEEADMNWGKHEVRIKRYINFINDCHEYSENRFNEETFEDDLEDIFNKNKTPNYIYLDHFGEFRILSREKRFILGNAKKFLKGTLSKKEVLDFVYYLDENLMMDEVYLLIGIPRYCEGDYRNEIDDLIKIGNRNYGEDRDLLDWDFADSFSWAVMPSKRITELSYF